VKNVQSEDGKFGPSRLRAVQIIPTDKSVVHHVLVFVLPEAALHDPALRRQSAIDDSRGYYAATVAVVTADLGPSSPRVLTQRAMETAAPPVCRPRPP
jgi:hypothetical protein